MSPTQFRGRSALTSYVYDAAGRVVRVVTASAWTDEDRALMMAWGKYQAGLCRCGFPKSLAWHHLNDAAYELDGEFVCYACTAGQDPDEDGVRRPVTYPVVVDVRDYQADPLLGPPEPQILTKPMH